MRVHDRLQVPGQVLVGVGRRFGRRRRAAVTAGVERDHPMAGALEAPGAMDYITASGGQAVQQDHRRPLSGLGGAETDPGSGLEVFLGGGRGARLFARPDYHRSRGRDREQLPGCGA